MLGLAVAELMRDVGGPRSDAHREVREQRCNEVGAGVRGLGDEAEAVRAEPGRELQQDERGGGRDRDERRAALRRHSRIYSSSR